MARQGLMGITIPVEDGGVGGTLMDAVIAIEQVTAVCPRSADVVQFGNFGPMVAGWRLEPILLREPATQPVKWLAAPQGRATRAFLEALRNFMYWENYDVRVRMDGKIDRIVLDDILKNHRT